MNDREGGGGGGYVSVEEAPNETHDSMSTSTVAEVLSGQSSSVEITLNNNDLEFHPEEITWSKC